jgi:hypothetical protein
MLSKKTSVELWFIIVRIGRMVRPLPRPSRMSTMKVERPSVFFATWSRGVVRASSSIRSECSARLVQIFWPLTMYLSPSRRASCAGCRVGAAGRLGDAEGLQAQRAGGDAGQVALLLLGEPCRSIVPMMYICAWQAAPLQPWRWISSRIAAAAESAEAGAAELLGDQRAR